MKKKFSYFSVSSFPGRKISKLTVLILFCVVFPVKIISAVAPFPGQITGEKNFGFMRQTGAWMSRELAVAHDDATVDISSLMSELIGWREFTITNNHAFAPYQPRLNISTQNALLLGGSNLWAAFKKNESILGFDLKFFEAYDYLKQNFSSKIDILPQNAELKITDGRAVKFIPEIIGQSVNLMGAVEKIKKSLFTKQSTIVLPLLEIPPSILLSQTNNLGINELIAKGESNFTGSSASRIQNIRTGAAKFDGLILKPGEEFSFNKYLGEVTAEQGFKPELVIKSAGTVPELGGGLCQVSTTAFRAALYGGLPITARKNHSYAVKYYAPQGTDATIYPGVVDFKFKNDASAHLLIHTRIEGAKLYFEFYGTAGDRKVIIDGPYQYDKQPSGAMKARLKRTVSYNGKRSEEDFLSKYVAQELFPTIYEYPTTPPSPAAGPTENSPSPQPNLEDKLN